MAKKARSPARFHQPPFPLNGFQLCLAFFSTALNLRSASPLITASGDYGVREKVAEFAEPVAGPYRTPLTIYLRLLFPQIKYFQAIVFLQPLPSDG